MERSFDAVVIGGGLVGLSCAAALARSGSVLVLERHPRVGLENSSRNSGVVHAGLHHPSAYARTRLCLRGRELLARRCVELGIPYRRTGKLLLALEPGDEVRLATLAARAEERGIASRSLDAAQLRDLEPQLRAHAALHIASTGIVRTQALLRSLLDECESAGVIVLTGLAVEGLEVSALGSFRVVAGVARFAAPRLVIAAGLEADRLAGLLGLDVHALGLRQRFVRGTWLALDDRFRKAVSHVVYPLPEAEGLGIHLTPDLDGFLLAGPDAESVERPTFELAPGKEAAFASAVGRYLPELRATDLHAHSVGVRPRLGALGEPPRDFAILGEAAHGQDGLYVLAGIESPGLTACLAIGEEVAGGLRRS